MVKNSSEVFKRNKVIPVAVFSDPDRALKTAEVLFKHSIDILEVTIRTPSAYDSIEIVAKKFPEITVGAGSILSVDSLKQARDRGAMFFVSPCLDQEVVHYASEKGLLFVPGISTPSEFQQALKTCSIIKIFPAHHLGGPEYIKAITAPFVLKEFSLIPTGGVNEKNYLDYLKVKNVISCGMSYIVDKDLIDAGNYQALQDRIKSIKSALSDA